MARRLLYLGSDDGGADQLADRYPNSSQNFTIPFWAVWRTQLVYKNILYKVGIYKVNTFLLNPYCTCNNTFTYTSALTHTLHYLCLSLSPCLTCSCHLNQMGQSLVTVPGRIEPP